MMSRWFYALAMLVLLGCSDVSKPVATKTAEVSHESPVASPPDDSPGAKTKTETTLPATAETRTPNAELETPSSDGHNRLTREELEAGWIRLFDGHTLFGWLPNSETAWTVADGVISAEGDVKGLLNTTTRFANYELRCDFKLEAGGNSGLFLRTPHQPKNPAADCYELNVCDSHPEFKSGSLVGRAKPADTVTADGAWHTFFVTVDGPLVVVQMDGQEVLRYTDETASPLTSGFIGLQMNGGKVEFRNVFLRPLGMQNLFDGETLTGWRIVPGSESQFTAKDGTIHVTGGRGFLETERTAGDFVLQFEAETHGDALNSGIFFRAEPGTQAAPSNGYEFQIQNGFKDGDRQQPADAGTGAIFRRVPARRVVANDRAWFTATLVADGPHFTTWIDGIQMVDWTDTRAPKDNPREGLRPAPGHFSLQGHDPGTDLSFRRLRLADLPR
jgi:hypothetical protein